MGRTLTLLLLVVLSGCSTGPRAEPRAATPATVTFAGTDRPGLLAQLESNQAVRWEMILRVPEGLFQCTDRVVGRESRHVYPWLACGDFSTGPDAEVLGASSLPAVVTLDDHRNVVLVRFPRQQTLRQDIRAMFPRDLEDRVIAGRIETRPSWDALLERARQEE